ncbi:hypothetical protein DFH07DRAFT_764739 [Mycena maculata]|uniref:Uncharacterized protein n=1 Tax=Mycena maculata TaxID=230809 RepID=A0AAD7KAQ8_9AGAR|nr:hypothetical protein DFH07DRAFT_764739 [Mycena maculata]
MSSSLPSLKRKLSVPSPEELRAAFDHDHWALIRANSSFVEAITYFDGDFTQVSCADAIQLFELLEPTLSEFCQCEEAAMGHADASIVEDFIYQIYVLFDTFCSMFPGLEQGRFALLQEAFRDREPPEKWFDEDFTIPEAHKRVENPFSQPPAARKALGIRRAPSASPPAAPPPTKKARSAHTAGEPDSGSDFEGPSICFYFTENPGLCRSIRDTRRPPPRPTSPPKTKAKAKPKGSTTSEVMLTSRAAGKQREVASSPAPLSTIAHEPEPNDDSDNDSIQIITENASSTKPVPTLGEFDPKVIGQANTAFKPSKGKGKIVKTLPHAPSVAPTVVAKHLVTSAGLPAEDIRAGCPPPLVIPSILISAFHSRSSLVSVASREVTPVSTRVPGGAALIVRRTARPATTRASPTRLWLLSTGSSPPWALPVVDLVATYIQQYLDDLKEFVFEFFQAEMALPAEHFHARFTDSETEAEIKALFARFEITFEDSLAHFQTINEIGGVFENADGEAVHHPWQHPSLKTPLARLDPSLVPKSVRAVAFDPENPPSDRDLTQVTPIHRVVDLKAPKEVLARFAPPSRPSVSSQAPIERLNPFARPPRDPNSFCRDPFVPPSRHEGLPSPEVEPNDDDMGERTAVGPSGIEGAPLGATARLFLQDMSLL